MKIGQETRDDLAKSITGGTLFAVLVIVAFLILYTILERAFA